MQFDSNNDFQRYLKRTDDGIHYVETMYYYNDNLLLGIRSYPGIKYFFQIYNLENDSLYVGLANKYSLEKEIDYRRIGFNTKSVFFDTFRDTLLIKETFCDTIFSTINLKTFSSRYILSLGKNKLPYSDDLLVRTQQKKQTGKNVVADNFCETSRYLFIRFDITKDIDRHMKLIIYDKVKNEMFVQEDLKIENDLDAGFNFSAFSFLRGKWSYNDRIYCLLESFEIKEMAEYFDQEDIDGADSFVKLAQDIDINDNPIIMVINLKKSEQKQ